MSGICARLLANSGLCCSNLIQHVFCAAKSDPWGGRIGSMSTLEFKDGYEVLQHVIASLPRQSGYQTWKSVFSKIDEDKSGMLDGVEMKSALAKITGSIKDEHIDLVMATLDSDRDGEVSYEVWV